jgi:hypothetical protein
MPSNVLPLRLKQTFLPIIQIFTEGEGDGIEFRLPFKIFSTLSKITCILFYNFRRGQGVVPDHGYYPIPTGLECIFSLVLVRS